MNVRWLFPYRTHLEDEIEFLRAQLAQQARRYDELQAMLLQPKPAATAPRAPAPIVMPKPMGWDAYRASRRAEYRAEEDLAAEEAKIDGGNDA